jgi:hypothetical protein
MDIAIFGSCVSRDVFAHENPAESSIVSYFARSSFASAFAAKPAALNPPELVLASSFQRRVVAADQTREFRRGLASLKFDLLLIDFIDERFDLLLDESCRPITMSNEALLGGLTAERGTIVRSGTDHFFSLWEQGWARFIRTMTALGRLNRVALNRVYWSSKTEHGVDYLPSYSQACIDRANNFLERMYARAVSDLKGHQVLQFGQDMFVGSDEHQWGKSPFHYRGGYYSQALAQLRTLGRIVTSTSDRSGSANSACDEPSSAEAVEAESARRQSLPFGALTTSPHLATLFLADAGAVHLVVKLACGNAIKPNQALVEVVFPGMDQTDLQRLGLDRSTEPAVGVYGYLNTTPGLCRTELRLELPTGCPWISVGLRTWFPSDDIHVVSAWLESVPIEPGN